MTAYPSQEADKFMLRMPDGMRDVLKNAAAANGRSMTAEIIHRLQAYENPTGETTMAKGNALTIRLSDETRAKLDELAARGPYRISLTSIVERGIELAAQELEALSAGKAGK